MNEKELTVVLDTLLSVPGMNDVVKVDGKLPRKTVLFLAQVIEKGLAASMDEKGAWSAVFDAQQISDIRLLGTEALARANLTELSEKLKRFQGS